MSQSEGRYGHPGNTSQSAYGHHYQPPGNGSDGQISNGGSAQAWPWEPDTVSTAAQQNHGYRQTPTNLLDGEHGPWQSTLCQQQPQKGPINNGLQGLFPEIVIAEEAKTILSTREAFHPPKTTASRPGIENVNNLAAGPSYLPTSKSTDPFSDLNPSDRGQNSSQGDNVRHPDISAVRPTGSLVNVSQQKVPVAPVARMWAERRANKPTRSFSQPSPGSKVVKRTRARKTPQFEQPGASTFPRRLSYPAAAGSTSAGLSRPSAPDDSSPGVSCLHGATSLGSTQPVPSEDFEDSDFAEKQKGARAYFEQLRKRVGRPSRFVNKMRCFQVELPSRDTALSAPSESLEYPASHASAENQSVVTLPMPPDGFRYVLERKPVDSRKAQSSSYPQSAPSQFGGDDARWTCGPMPPSDGQWAVVRASDHVPGPWDHGDEKNMLQGTGSWSSQI